MMLLLMSIYQSQMDFQAKGLMIMGRGRCVNAQVFPFLYIVAVYFQNRIDC